MAMIMVLILQAMFECANSTSPSHHTSTTILEMQEADHALAMEL
jgi:hypothetical protein